MPYSGSPMAADQDFLLFQGLCFSSLLMYHKLLSRNDLTAAKCKTSFYHYGSKVIWFILLFIQQKYIEQYDILGLGKARQT